MGRIVAIGDNDVDCYLSTGELLECGGDLDEQEALTLLAKIQAGGAQWVLVTRGSEALCSRMERDCFALPLFRWMRSIHRERGTR